MGLIFGKRWGIWRKIKRYVKISNLDFKDISKRSDVAKNKRISQDDLSNESVFFTAKVISALILFLTISMPKTIAIRFVSMLMIALNFSNKKIANLAQCSVRTVRDLRKKCTAFHSGKWSTATAFTFL